MIKIKLEDVRVAFPHLFEPVQINGQGEYKYRVVLLIDKNDKDKINAIESAILQAAKEKWGDKAESIIKLIRGNPMRFCFRDGAEKSQYDGFEGCMSLSASNTTRPLILDYNLSPLAKVDGKPYAGSYVNVIIEFFAYDKQGKGISAAFTGMQFVKDGDAFTGGVAAKASDFTDLSLTDEDVVI